MNKILLAISTLVVVGSAHAGFNGLTWHSRANCINNESISWDWTTYRNMRTLSSHFRNGLKMHTVEAPFKYTWRSAAVHYVEAYPGAGWRVTGEHYMLQNNQFIVLGYENVVDCSIYGGWWDFDNQ